MDSQIEPDLSQEGQLSSAVLDALVAPVVVVDRQGRIVRFNRACERISGYPYAEAAGRRYWELLIPPEHIAETRARFEALQLETVPGQVEGDWLARDGSTHRISWRRTVLLDGDGRVVYIVAIGQEINGARPIVEEAHSLAQLPEQNPFPVLRISASGLVLYANSPASALLAEEGVQVGQQAPQALGDPARQALASDRGFFIEYPGLGKIFSFHLAPIVEQGHVNLYGRDLAAERQAAAERDALFVQLEAERARWQATVESLLEPVTVSDAAGHAIYMNEAYMRMIERTIQPGLDLEQHSQFYAIYHPDGTLFDPLELPLQRAAARDEAVRNVELVQRSASGGEHIAVWNASPIHDATGKLLGAVAVGHEITEQRRAEQALRASNEQLARALASLEKQNEQLESLNRDLKDFAFIASHDLQEPLRKIRTFTDWIQARYATGLDAAGQDYLDRLGRAAAHMQAMVDDLLVYSRVTSLARPFGRVDLNRLAGEAVSDLEVPLTQTGGQVELDDLPQVEADPAQFRHLFLNLIDNGLKFHRSGVPPVVRVYSRILEDAAQPALQIVVEDNGIGIEDRYQDRIFQPFQRLNSRKAYEGTGMGLTICRKIVERHAGTLTVSSTPGEGSRFTVTLPYKA